MKDIGALVGYTVLWDRVSKVVGARMQMCYYPAAPQFHVMAVLYGNRVVRVLCVWVATPCCVAACVCVGVAAECTRMRLMAHGSASTSCFMFLIMPKRRDCAKSVSASSNNLNRRQSWLMALESMVGSNVPLMALVWSTLRRTVEKAAVRWSRVLVSVVPACPMGMATNSNRPQYCLRAVTRGEYFSVFSVCFLSHPRSRENPTSMRMRVHVFLSKLVSPGSGVSGTTLAYMRYGDVPWPPSKRACVPSNGNTHGGIRLGAVVHSAS
jgi:hypothetical protein